MRVLCGCVGCCDSLLGVTVFDEKYFAVEKMLLVSIEMLIFGK